MEIHVLCEEDVGLAEHETDSGPSLTARMVALGFDWLCFFRLRRVGEQLVRLVYLDRYAPEDWACVYLHSRYVEVDPRLACLRRHGRALVWDLPSLEFEMGARGQIDARTGRFLSDARQMGLASGITMQFFDRSANEQTVVEFCSKRVSKTWIVDAVIGQAYMLGAELHQRATHAGLPVQQSAVSDALLTEFERALLTLVIDGLTARQIGRQLNLTEHDVRQRVRKIQQKLGAANWVNLAYTVGMMARWRKIT
jgi:DNA-binding CsgD family transcriptional regulator